MTREEIEQEARAYSALIVGGPRHIKDFYEREKYEAGFISGANWRIDSVWHDASEMPENRFALVEYDCFPKGHGFLIVPDPREVIKAITRWAYVEDLLPNMEE